MAIDPDQYESERKKSLEPYESEEPVIRASDADRDRAVAQLRQHLAEGRLTVEEFTERLDEAYAARTTAELQRALRELPHVRLPDLLSPDQEARGSLARRRRGELVRHAGLFVLVNGFMVAIWLLTSIAVGELIFFWPAFLMVTWGLGLAVHAWQVHGPGED